MKRLLLLPLVFFMASCAARPPVRPTPAPPKSPFEGEWRETRNQDKPVTSGKTWAFSGNSLTIREGGKTFSGTFAYNKASSPGEIDLQFEGYQVNSAIYRIEGDTLTVKVLDTGTSRAKEFGLESGYTSITCTRVKK